MAAKKSSAQQQADTFSLVMDRNLALEVVRVTEAAALAASRFATRVDRVVLLAPAVMFAKPGHHLLPAERIEEWRRRGTLPFFHYAHNEERLLNVSFYEDSLTHDAFNAALPQSDTAKSASASPRIVVVDMPGAGQAAVVVARQGIRRIDPAYTSAIVA